MPRTRILACFLVCFISTAGSLLSAKDSENGWQSVAAEERAIKDCPNDPGCPAMILYREETIDDVSRVGTIHYRIKIFTDEGKDYGNVSIPYAEKSYKIEDVRGRTVRPDGRVIDFAGQLYDSVALKTRKLKYQVKAFALPDVERGSIVEYAYRFRWKERIPDVYLHRRRYRLNGTHAYLTAEWTVSNRLFTRDAVFKFRPDPRVPIVYSQHGIVASSPSRKLSDGTLVFEYKDIPAIRDEGNMPPEYVVDSWLKIFYATKVLLNTRPVWRTASHRRDEEVEKFIGKPKLVKEEVEKIVSPSDPPEAKLKKLYDRAQQIRLLSFEHSRTAKERKQEHLKENHSVRDVLERGYARSNEVNYLFVAMCRAAGIPAQVVLLMGHDQGIFDKDDPDVNELNVEVVRVRLGTDENYFDPATLYCPFGLLPWEKAGSGGIALSGAESLTGKRERELSMYTSSTLIWTPQPQSGAAVTERSADLKLNADGSIAGELSVTFQGEEALRRRIKYREQDSAGRRKALETEVQSWLPYGAKVTLKNSPAWETPDWELRAVFEIDVPVFATPTPRRLLVAPALFQSRARYPFRASRRTYSVYLRYPFRVVDDVRLQPPPGYSLEALPDEKREIMDFSRLDFTYRNESGILHFHRLVEIGGWLFKVGKYPGLRSFFDEVRAGDQQLAVFESRSLALHK